MKFIVIFLIITLITVGIFMLRSKFSVSQKAPSQFVILDSEHSTSDHLPIVSGNFLEEIELKYSDKEWKRYPNEYTDLMEKLYDDVYSPWRGEVSHAEFLSEMTNEQKLYFALINFEGQTNNGGVYQFLFNMPELSIITLEAMKAANLEKLAADYEVVLQEFFGKFETIQDLKSKFQQNNKSWDKRWSSFAEGYQELESTSIIESYFFSEDYKKEFQGKVIQFIKENKSGLMKTQGK